MIVDLTNVLNTVLYFLLFIAIANGIYTYKSLFYYQHKGNKEEAFQSISLAISIMYILSYFKILKIW